MDTNTLHAVAWIILRICYAWMFIYPMIGLCRDMKSAEATVALLFPYFTRVFTWLMLAVMLVGGVMILIGWYAQIAGILLFFYSIFGIFIHRQLAAQVVAHQLSAAASESDRSIFTNATTLGYVGHITSGQKNVVIAAVALFIVLVSSGPWSLTPPLF